MNGPMGGGIMQGMGNGMQGGLKMMMMRRMMNGGQSGQQGAPQPGQPMQPPNPYANANFANIVDGGYNPVKMEAAMDQALGGGSQLPSQQRFPQAATQMPPQGLMQRLMGRFGGGGSPMGTLGGLG